MHKEMEMVPAGSAPVVGALLPSHVSSNAPMLLACSRLLLEEPDMYASAI
jgi:hypothetical protein